MLKLNDDVHLFFESWKLVLFALCWLTVTNRPCHAYGGGGSLWWGRLRTSVQPASTHLLRRLRGMVQGRRSQRTMAQCGRITWRKGSGQEGRALAEAKTGFKRVQDLSDGIILVAGMMPWVDKVLLYLRFTIHFSKYQEASLLLLMFLSTDSRQTIILAIFFYSDHIFFTCFIRAHRILSDVGLYVLGKKRVFSGHINQRNF